MSAEERSIRTIVILGAGLVGLSAALAFRRGLPRLQLTLIEAPADPNALTERLPGCLPTIHRFHASIGINELDLIRDHIAFHHLGTRFQDWSHDGGPWQHVFGDYGRPAGLVPFHQLWVRARRQGRALSFHAYSAAAAMAEAGKFVHPSADPNSLLAPHLYGLRLDPELYRRQLRTQADRLSIDSVKGVFEAAERRADGGLAAIILRGGQRVEADLFLDCGGPSAVLLAAVDRSFEDWSAFLPADRLALDSSPAVQEALTGDRVAATDWGWRLDSRIPGRSLNASLWRQDVAAPELSESAEILSLRPGRRPRPWVRNVLALGDAAIAVDPLENCNLHLAHNSIARALELLPGRDCHPLELGEYNRRTGQEAERVRDFLALHYLRSGRSAGAFWKAAARAAPPDSLAHSLDQFERRGRLPFYEEETFGLQSWLAVLLGMGIIPTGFDPVAAAVNEAQAEAAMEGLARQVANLPNQLPAYSDYLRRMVEVR